jgi:opine dehydrogenase
MKIAILGAGHGGCAAAVDLGLRGFEVSLYNRSPQTVEPLQAIGGVYSVGGVYGDQFVPVPVITCDIEKAIEGADVLMVTVPTTAHGYYATLLAPYVTEDHIVLLNPGHTGGSLAFVRTMREKGAREPVKCCETCSLAYVARKQAPDRVSVFRVASRNFTFAAFPGKHQQHMAQVVRDVYAAIEPVANVLETGLMNGNAILHPAGMLMNAGWVEHTGGGFRFYAEGVTPGVARVLQAADDERVALTTALGLKPKSLIRYFYEIGNATKEAFETGSMYRVVHESPPNQSIKAPDSLDHRFVHEDVGFGLKPMSELAALVGVRTPTLDALIHFASLATGVDYSEYGLTLDKMGLAGLALNQLEGFLDEGTLP